MFVENPNTSGLQSPYGHPLSELEPPPCRSEGKTRDWDRYRVEWTLVDPGKGVWGYTLQHRVVAAWWLGRPLKREEVVHHEDEDRMNNRPENLWLFPTNSAHMFHHKRESPKYSVALADTLRPLALCPRTSRQVAAETLGVTLPTVDALCQVHGIEWVSAAQRVLSEESVREALQGCGTLEAAQALGVNHQTLRNHFPHLLKKRASPGILDAHKAEIHSLATHTRAAELADRYGVNPETVKSAIRRWSKSEPDEWSDIRAFQQSRRGIRWSRKHKA